MFIEWLPDDQFSDETSISFASDEDVADAPIAGPGVYEISWRK